MRQVCAVVLSLALLVGCTPGEGTFAVDRSPGVDTPQGLLPSVVVDPARRRLYLRRPSGEVAAISADDRATLWTAAAGEPLILVASMLAVLQADADTAHRFRIAWLDPNSGTEAAAPSPLIELPAWVSVAAARGRSFYTQPSVDGDKLVLRWQARSWYASGAKPNSQMREGERRTAGGVLEVDSGGTVRQADELPEASGQAHLIGGASPISWTWRGSPYAIARETIDGRLRHFLVLGQESESERVELATDNAQVGISRDGGTVTVFQPPSDVATGGCSLWALGKGAHPKASIRVACKEVPLSATIVAGVGYLLMREKLGRGFRLLRALRGETAEVLYEVGVYEPPRQTPQR